MRSQHAHSPYAASQVHGVEDRPGAAGEPSVQRAARVLAIARSGASKMGLYADASTLDSEHRRITGQAAPKDVDRRDAAKISELQVIRLANRLRVRAWENASRQLEALERSHARLLAQGLLKHADNLQKDIMGRKRELVRLTEELESGLKRQYVCEVQSTRPSDVELRLDLAHERTVCACPGCDEPKPDTARSDWKFHSVACRMKAHRAEKRAARR
jgi:hypothetical protein